MEQREFKNTKWIETDLVIDREDVVVYKKRFSLDRIPLKAELLVTACGVYVAWLNDYRVSMILAPGFDCFQYRMPYHVYDVTDFIGEDNTLRISVARGWYGWFRSAKLQDYSRNRRMKALLVLTFADGETQLVETDESWLCCRGNCIKSDIYNGEEYDATLVDCSDRAVKIASSDFDDKLFLFDGEKIGEQERLKPIACFTTPKGEYVIDFGQNLTGYLEIELTAKSGEVLEISHAEVLDKEGNFYTENYRQAKSKIKYVCKNGKQSYKPLHTFFGFRYIRLDQKPNGVDINNFTAVVVHSDINRTGYVRSSNPKLNRFFENVVWGQKDNFLDIPIDCPQRDERMGWTGDAQVFCRTAMYNFDCEKFYARWLRMVACEQAYYGYTPTVVPDVYEYGRSGFTSAWSDVSTIVPWTMYEMYGSKALLEEFFIVMKRHVDAITSKTEEKYLWIGGDQLGDWLALDGGNGKPAMSDKYLISSAFYAYSTSLLIKAGNALGKEMTEYVNLYANIRRKFMQVYAEPKTQTECALSLAFDLTDDKKAMTRRLVECIENCGGHLQTGFIGTPYLLRALSDNGETELAYELLLRESYPSWLYAVNRGATTVWERWNGIDENGDLAKPSLNSFNHYAYGAVADWIYEVAAGIKPEEAGFRKVRIEPKPSDKLEWLDVRFTTQQGQIAVKWEYKDGKVQYEIETPVDAILLLDGKEYTVTKGKYIL